MNQKIIILKTYRDYLNWKDVNKSLLHHYVQSVSTELIYIRILGREK